MKKIIFALPVLLLASSCAAPTSHFGFGIIGNTVEPITVTSNARTTRLKSGKACGQNFLGLVNNGDISVETAMKNGGIKKIVTVEKEANRMVVMTEICTVVKGY